MRVLKSALAALLLLSTILSGLSATPVPDPLSDPAPKAAAVKAGDPAPFAGTLFAIPGDSLVIAILEDYPDKLAALEGCRRDLEGERSKARKFWRRPAFWMPIACVAFAGGIGIGVFAPGR